MKEQHVVEDLKELMDDLFSDGIFDYIYLKKTWNGLLQIIFKLEKDVLMLLM